MIARVPLFFFQAIQVSLLPRLATLHAQGDRRGFGMQVRKLLVLTGGLTVAGTAGAFAIGTPVVSLLFGDEYALSPRDLTLLALASGVYMIGVVASQGVVALSGHALVALGWGVGVGAFVTGVSLFSDLLLRVEIGLVAGMVSATFVLLACLTTQWRAWQAAVPTRP